LVGRERVVVIMKNYQILNNHGKLALKNFLTDFAKEPELLINHHFDAWINSVEQNKNDNRDYLELPKLYCSTGKPEIFNFNNSYFERI
jgi:hypothetical protein